LKPTRARAARQSRGVRRIIARVLESSLTCTRQRRRLTT
jgi:hypothetical protein